MQNQIIKISVPNVSPTFESIFFSSPSSLTVVRNSANERGTSRMSCRRPLLRAELLAVAHGLAWLNVYSLLLHFLRNCHSVCHKQISWRALRYCNFGFDSITDIQILVHIWLLFALINVLDIKCVDVKWLNVMVWLVSLSVSCPNRPYWNAVQYWLKIYGIFTSFFIMSHIQ